jgi:transglutaminase-like putative cysteine protease
MSFHSVYRASFYLMLFFATLVLSVDATDVNRLAMLYPVLVAVAGGVAFFTVDRHPHLGLSNNSSNVLGLASIALTYLEYRVDETLLLLALAHWLVYLQLVKMFRSKSFQDDWFLFLNGLVQVLVGSVMSQSDTVGFALFAWGLSSLWVLALFTLLREVDRGRPSPGTKVFPSPNLASPYPGLIDPPFVLASLRVAVMTLALGGIIFLVMPRRNTMGTSLKGDTVAKHLTGFDDEVQLGQLGEILENDSMVMTIDLSDEEGRKIVPNEEQLWRGVGMARYDRGRWRKMAVHPTTLSIDRSRHREYAQIRQQIKLEATDNPILFGHRPILEVSYANKRLSPEFNEADGSIIRQDSRPQAVEYTVISSTDPNQIQLKERFPGPIAKVDILSISPELKAQLRPIAEKVVEGTDPTDRHERAQRILHYLRESGLFSYTLQMDVIDSSIDPVADFLLNRKQGHCEYFASAQTLLLRSIDIPARLVNGFKGGDWNDLAGVLNVRQKHAHSWCEVLLADKGVHPDDPPHWETLDPTPATERNRSVAMVGGVSMGVRQFSDFVRYIWTFYIVGFNFDRQQRFLYEPIRRLFLEAKHGFQMMGQGLRVAFDWLFHFPDVTSFISFRGFLVTFFTLTFLLAVSRLGMIVARRLRRIWGGSRKDHSGLAAGVFFYRRLVSLLEAYGLERPPAETPREFARRAAGFLAGHGSGNESVADVPPLVVDAYYRIRFGQIDLDPEALHQVENRLDALEARLHPAAT